MNLGSWGRGSGGGQMYYGWKIVAASCFMMFFASGIFFRGFSVFFVPLRDSLHLTNFQTSLVFSISRAEGGLEGPAAGYLIERFGTRRLAVVGIVVTGIGYLLFTQVDSFLLFAVIYLGMISLGASLSFQHAVFAGLNMWFIRRRAFVLSLLAASASFGGVVMIPGLTLLIAGIGWEWAAFGAGLTFLLVVLPFTIMLRPSPESMELLPDGEQPADNSHPVQSTQQRGRQPLDPRDYGVSEALHTASFWFLLVGMGLRQLAVMGLLVNLQPILIWKGASLETAGYLISFMLAVNVAARLALGWAADRWAKPPIMTACLISGSVGILMLLIGSWNDSQWAIILFLVLIGVGESAGIIGWATLGDFFGRRKFATLRGIITFSQSWALVGSPMFVGWWADHTDGSYSLSLALGLGFLIVGALCFVLLKKPTRRPTTN